MAKNENQYDACAPNVPSTIISLCLSPCVCVCIPDTELQDTTDMIVNHLRPASHLSIRMHI